MLQIALPPCKGLRWSGISHESRRLDSDRSIAPLRELEYQADNPAIVGNDGTTTVAGSRGRRVQESPSAARDYASILDVIVAEWRGFDNRSDYFTSLENYIIPYRPRNSRVPSR